MTYNAKCAWVSQKQLGTNALQMYYVNGAPWPHDTVHLPELNVVYLLPSAVG